MLRSLALMLLFEMVALDTLRHVNIPGGIKVTALSRSGVKFTREPFFRSLLLAIYKSRLGDLLRRARIAIPESHGRLLMGVIDETGSLQYGQVFVRYSKLVSEPGKGLTTLKGRVVISKNPCFHPGKNNWQGSYAISHTYRLILKGRIISRPIQKSFETPECHSHEYTVYIV